jgi:hypothetical protein
MIHFEWWQLLLYAAIWVTCGIGMGRSSLRAQMMKRNIRKLQACKGTDDPLHTYDVIAQTQAVLDACIETRKAGIF